jgi:hypothetical protein
MAKTQMSMRSAARDDPKVVCPAVRVAGGEEFDEAAAGALAAGVNNGRQRLEPGTDQYQRRRDLVGQYDRLLRHNRLKARLRNAPFPRNAAVAFSPLWQVL